MLRKTVSGITLIALLMGMLALAFNVQLVKASPGTIYIRADGSVVGTTSIHTADNVTYVFTANINDSIVVQRNNIMIDGNGYTLQGTGEPYSKGVDLSGRTNVTVQNVTIGAFYYGIWLNLSSSNILSGNNIANSAYGIYLGYSSNNTVSGNNITANSSDGIRLGAYSSNNMISGNNITNNYLSILLSFSSNNTVSGNNITNNYNGILLGSSSNNTIYHNNFIDNHQQVSSSTSMNVWDAGYPSGGNYWSDYNGTDANHDGIGDMPYSIDANNTDRYPLMKSYTIPEFQSLIVLPLLVMATVLTAVVYRRKRAQKN